MKNILISIKIEFDDESNIYSEDKDMNHSNENQSDFSSFSSNFSTFPLSGTDEKNSKLTETSEKLFLADYDILFKELNNIYN